MKKEKTIQELMDMEAIASSQKNFKKAEKIRWQIQAILDENRRLADPNWQPPGYTGRNSKRRR